MATNKNNIEAIYPLSPMQQGMLFHTLYNPASGVYFEQLQIRLSGPLDVLAFKRTWLQLVEHHPVLRTHFVWQDLKEPLQIVRQQVSLPWIEHDWRHLSEQEQQKQLAQFLIADRATSFTLTQAPLLRVVLCRLAEQCYRCVVSFHHLIIDGWSMPLLLDELLALYEAYSNERSIAVAPRRPYRDYITWLQHQNKEEAEAFWRRSLQYRTAPTSLKTDRLAGRKSAQEAVSDSEQHIDLAPATTAALRSLTQRHKLTMNTLIQGAWAILLSQYSGEEDVLFGAVVSGRPPELAGIETMIGMFINTLPVRLRVLPEETLLSWLQQLQEQLIEARQYEYSSLVQVQGWSEIPRGLPLFESMVVFENYPTGSRSPEGDTRLSFEFEQALEQTNCPLSLEVSLHATALCLRIVYDSTRFDAAAIRRKLAHLCIILERMASHPEQRLAECSLLTPAERWQMLTEWNDTHSYYPDQACFHQLFEAQVERTPEVPAVALGTESLTYAEVNRRANQLAFYLRSLHVGPDSLVGLYMERSLEMVVGLLGILKAGGAYVPLDPLYPQERLAFMINDARMPVVLTTRHLSSNLALPDSVRAVPLDADWPSVALQGTQNPTCTTRAGNLAYVIYTSGSTGRPKGVLISHQGLVNYLTWSCQRYRVAESNGSVVHSSLAFDLTVTSLLAPLLVGARSLLLPEDRGIETLGNILRQGHNFGLVKITPAHLELLNRYLSSHEMATSTRALIIGGEALQEESLVPWHRYTPDTMLINEYGPTETVVGCCIFENTGEERGSGTVPIGRPIANTRLYLLNASLQPVPLEVPGELYIGGAGLARGYLNRPALTAERFVPDPFCTEQGARMYRTGDQARYHLDGTIEFLGRLDNQLKLRGLRIEAGEIEAALCQHPDVREAVVVLREGLSGGKRLVAYIVTDDGRAVSSTRLRHTLKEQLPNYMIPSAFVSLEVLPLTSNGKVDRQALPEPGEARPALEKVFVLPRTPTEKQLVEIWCQALGIKQIGIHDNFFELGGDSILGIQIIDRARRQFLKVTLKQLFQHPTISELALVAEPFSALSAEQGTVDGSMPLTPIQRWFFEQELTETWHWNQAMLLEGCEALDPALMKQAIAHLLTHHDALRMRFSRQGNSWQQEYAPVHTVVPFTYLDLSELPRAEQEQKIASIEAQQQGSLDLEKGLLLQAAFFHLGTHRPCRLLLIIHHLVVDSVSWRILLEDLQTAYRQLSQGEAVRLPAKTTSFKLWSERLMAYAQSSALRDEQAYWLAEARARVEPLPLDYPVTTESNLESAGKTITLSMSTDETRALLLDVPNVYHTQINDVLLTALALAFYEWTGSKMLLVNMEGHGREDILEGLDLSHTVGWFTSLFPVLLELEDVSTPGQALKTIKEQLRRLPERGIGYGLLRYLSQDHTLARHLRTLPAAEVSFNYLGQLDQAYSAQALWRECNESHGPTHSLRSKRSHFLDIGGLIVDGQLRIQWQFSEQLHHRTTIERLAERYMQKLRSIINYCQSPEVGEHTPSDFPLAALNEQKLNELSYLLQQIDEGEEATL